MVLTECTVPGADCVSSSWWWLSFQFLVLWVFCSRCLLWLQLLMLTVFLAPGADCVWCWPSLQCLVPTVPVTGDDCVLLPSGYCVYSVWRWLFSYWCYSCLVRAVFSKGGHPQFKSATRQYCGQPNRLRSCGLKKSCGIAIADLQNLTSATFHSLQHYFFKNFPQSPANSATF